MISFAAGVRSIVGRLVLDPLSSQLGQPVVVENRGGAGGTIGTGLVAKADPDGYTVLVQASAHSAAPAAYPNITYDVAKVFVAIIPFGTLPNVTVVAPASGIQTLKDLAPRPRRDRSPTPPPASAAPPMGRRAHQGRRRFHRCHVPFRAAPRL